MVDNIAQRNSATYRLPAEDTDFILNRDEMRTLRFSLEYSKADLILRDWGVRSTVVVFGSARVPSPEAAEAALSGAKTGDERAHAEKLVARSRRYAVAQEFGRLVSLHGGALHPKDGVRDNVIATGGGPGLMEAANRGAAQVGAPSIGFNIRLPMEQEPNAFSTPELTFRFHYFAMRKMHLAMRANALAVFPGGFGTFDELFEILTLEQTGKAPRMPIVLFDPDYWHRIINFDALLEEEVISAQDMELFAFAETAEEGWQILLDRGLVAHNDDEV